MTYIHIEYPLNFVSLLSHKYACMYIYVELVVAVHKSLHDLSPVTNLIIAAICDIVSY